MRARTPGESDRPSAIAVDAARHVRPGVPRESALRSGANGTAPEPQGRGVRFMGLGRAPAHGAAAVFGTAQPLRGLSGAVRRVAYRTPEHRTARWMLLLAGDRLDVLEHRLARGLWLLPAATALVLGYAAVSRGLRRR
jgi:hypothetical protein